MAHMIFPIKGKHIGFGTEVQPQFTSRRIDNMRPYNTQNGILIGGQRPGLDKWGAGTQIGGAAQPIVAMCIVSSVA